MSITIKTAADIEGMRLAGRLGAEVLDYITPFVKAGVTTGELDRLCHDYMVNVQGTVPAPLNYCPDGYTPYPKSVCTSVNDVICHGIPGDKVLKNGDAINIDVTVIKDGYHGDNSRMFLIGEPTKLARRLAEVTYECMWLGIAKVKPGAHLGDIGHVIQQHAEKNGYSVVREFCGHGIGKVFHEEPQVLHYGRPGTLEKLVPGMIFTIEPMINAGRRDIRAMNDGWTIKTKDRSLSAQWEHTVLVTETGYEVLTVSAGTPPPPAIILQQQAGAADSAPAPRGSGLSVTQARTMTSALAPNPLPRELLKAQLKSDRQVLIAHFRDDGKPEKLLRGLRQSVDAVLVQAWESVGLPASAALVGVGGYGRGELFPQSDVDILILLPAPANAIMQARLEEMVQLLWDLGLEIGHSIRTVDECMTESEADITVQTSLLEARLVHGNAGLFDELQRRYAAAMDPQAFFQAKTAEMRLRHAKYEDTAFSLEPNCKESPGGLRDLQVILWVAKAAGLASNWGQFATRGLITQQEARQLMEKERAFKDIRVRLHLHTNRREDRLVFDVQTQIAETFGLANTGEGLNARRASELLMQRYYVAAKTVTQLNTILLQNIEAQLFPQPCEAVAINERFSEVNGLIDIARDDTFTATPPAVLEVFLLMTQRPHIKGMTARTMRALWHARFEIDEAFRQDPVNRAVFLRILQAPVGLVHALRRMNDTSVLGRYLPNFRRIVGQMQHDLFHVYTVDQHIMMVVRNMRRFTMSEHAHEYPFCSQLIANFARPWLLYIGALFHDIAKGRGGDHSKLGTVDAAQFCEDHSLSPEDSELVVFLVEQHLTMSTVAQKHDLSDPDVIAAFARKVKDERHLTALYLLTVADIRGTSPKVWNAWKAKLLEDLYRMTLRVLGGEAHSADRELKNRQQEALATLRLYGLPVHAHEALWKQLDVAYFLRHDASDIAWQTRALWDRLDGDKPVVKCRLAPIGEGLQVAVYVKDQPDLFARICSYFDRKNFSILDAKIHTTHHGYALDSFLVTEQNFAKSYRDIINLIEHEIGELLASTAPLPAPTRGRLSRLCRNFPMTPTVDLRPDEKGQYYILSIAAHDRNGLLYAIAAVLARYRINLHTAKIMTLGERVEDVFLIDGAALNNARNQLLLETDLLEALKS